jgi:hypothetical protein
VGTGTPEYEAKRYEVRMKNGGILVSVHCDSSDWVSKARDILKAAGGEDIASAGEKAAGTHGVEPPFAMRANPIRKLTEVRNWRQPGDGVGGLLSLLFRVPGLASHVNLKP